MKKKITIEYQVLESAKELDYADNELLNRAIKIADVAHSPYSQFNVGAAVRMDNGEILAASNQEMRRSLQAFALNVLLFSMLFLSIPTVLLRKLLLRPNTSAP